MKVQLNDGRITLVTKEKGLELIANGLGLEYKGHDPEVERVREALAVPEKPTEKIEVTHMYIVDEEE